MIAPGRIVSTDTRALATSSTSARLKAGPAKKRGNCCLPLDRATPERYDGGVINRQRRSTKVSRPSLPCQRKSEPVLWASCWLASAQPGYWLFLNLRGCLEHVVVQPLQPRSLPRWPKIVGPRTTMVSCHRQLLGGRLRAGGRASRPSRNRVPYRQCRGCPKTSLRHVRLPSSPSPSAPRADHAASKNLISGRPPRQGEVKATSSSFASVL
jgi:hypothetical protein